MKIQRWKLILGRVINIEETKDISECHQHMSRNIPEIVMSTLEASRFSSLTPIAVQVVGCFTFRHQLVPVLSMVSNHSWVFCTTHLAPHTISTITTCCLHQGIFFNMFSRQLAKWRSVCRCKSVINLSMSSTLLLFLIHSLCFLTSKHIPNIDLFILLFFLVHIWMWVFLRTHVSEAYVGVGKYELVANCRYWIEWCGSLDLNTLFRFMNAVQPNVICMPYMWWSSPYFLSLVLFNSCIDDFLFQLLQTLYLTI